MKCKAEGRETSQSVSAPLEMDISKDSIIDTSTEQIQYLFLVVYGHLPAKEPGAGQGLCAVTLGGVLYTRQSAASHNTSEFHLHLSGWSGKT